MTQGYHHINWDKSELEELYLERHLSIREICALKQLSYGAVRKALCRFNVKLRTTSESLKLAYLKGINAFNFQNTKDPNNHHWNGGKYITSSGYVKVYNLDHPRAVKNHVFEHILVWEKAHGYPVPHGFIIHHLNGIKHDNRPENLVAIPRSFHNPMVYRHILQQRIRTLEKQVKRFRHEFSGDGKQT